MGRLTSGEDSDLELVRTVVEDKHHRVILVVKLESNNPLRKRYLVIVSAPASSKPTHSPTSTRPSSATVAKSQELDYCLLGVDAIYSSNGDGEPDTLVAVTIGFVLKILWGSKVSLDGDGGFSVRQLGKHFVFKPKSVQALWTVIQTLHLTSSKLKPKRQSLCLGDSDWVKGYEKRIQSPQSCINEWNAMPDILVRRAPSPDELTRLTSDQVDQETKKCLIKSKLREIMKTVDLDNITSKSIRVSLENQLNQKLDEFKAFIDEEILLILGQMDPASMVFDFLYLGSEWNASNLEELNHNGVTHILNVTREIDNFFPSVFQYLNIREYDVEETDLLKYWDKTYIFIKDCLSKGGKVLVHCKMGISRSASTVVAFAMKYFDWSMAEALDHVKKSRGVIDPNKGFRNQLRVYEGILEASKKRITFRKQRSKSESNATDSPRVRGKGRWRRTDAEGNQILATSNLSASQESICDKSRLQVHDKKSRPKSWSPSYTSFIEKQINQSSEQDTIICHCYTQLAQHFSRSNALPSNIGGNRQEIDINPGDNELKGIVEATNPQVQIPLSKFEDTSECPATSHIDECTCNVELELKVSEKPVDVSAHIECAETDRILKNLGNFPIHIRQTQGTTTTNNVVFRDWRSYDTDSDVINEVEREIYNSNKQFCLDTSGAEELSVKTLADMFDFKLGEEPAKPPLTARHNKLGESKIGEIAKKLSITDCSEC